MPKWRVPPAIDNGVWEGLLEKAQLTVRQTIDALPEEVRVIAANLPCLYRQWSTPAWAPALGHYFGYVRGHVSEFNGPIVLYLGSIHLEARRGGLDFCEVVRSTYLHELGHHLGLDEAALAARGLG